MKIEFTNADNTAAIVTKGWFWKRRALVYQREHGGRWRFVANGTETPFEMNGALDQAQIWCVREPLPAARVVP